MIKVTISEGTKTHLGESFGTIFLSIWESSTERILTKLTPRSRELSDLRDRQTRAFANLVCPLRGARGVFGFKNELERLPMVPTKAIQGKC